MAAAANKPGAVHYALIMFVMLSVILGIFTYLFNQTANDKTAEVTKLNDENQKLNKVQKTLNDQVEILKTKIGIKFDQVDDPNNPQNQATVVRGLETEMLTNGKDAAGTTVFETLRKLREALDAASADRDSKAAKVASLEKEVLGLKNQYQSQVDNYSQQTKDAERDNLEKLSFEAADGIIRRVEHNSNTVWINRGDADYLKPRMTFSVYAKENLGVGRGAEDIKGKIEVTRILEPHMAEARVVEEDLYRPIVSGDLIYTPIWDPGRIEKISVIGGIDMDGDGRSDREQFHQMMAVAGCVIDNEVDENGVRTPKDGKITVNTRFFVKGDIPELPDVTGDEAKAKVKEVQRHFTEMREEARSNGVRIIKMNDFLAYIGYHTKRRTFLPGQNRPWNLKAGSASESTKDVSGDRTSNGNVSGAYSKGRQAPQNQSDGANSKVFGGSK